MERDLQKEFDNIVKELIIPFFKELGFKRNGNNYNKVTSDIVQVINIQKSQWNDRTSVSFTLNIGFFNGDIHREAWNKEIPKSIKEYDCQVGFRLGQLTKKRDYNKEFIDRLTRVADLYNIEISR